MPAVFWLGSVRIFVFEGGEHSQDSEFPLIVEKNGRIGKIWRLKRGTFKTHFRFAGKPPQKTFATIEAARDYLLDRFTKIRFFLRGFQPRLPGAPGVTLS